MREALTSLPGVEKDSVKVNHQQKLATFKAKDPKSFKVDDAIQKINGLGGKYKATVNKTGKAFADAGEAEPASGKPAETGSEKKG